MARAAPGATFPVDFICCQTRECGKPSLSVSIGPKLPDAPFKCSQISRPFETCQTGSWRCQTRGRGAVASQVFLFLLARNCRILPSTLQTPPNPSKPLDRAQPALGAAKLGAVASQVFLFLLARNCRMLLSNAPKFPDPSKRAKPALGGAKLPN